MSETNGVSSVYPIAAGRTSLAGCGGKGLRTMLRIPTRDPLMRRSFIAPAIFLAAIAAFVVGWQIYAKDEAGRFAAVHKVRMQRSILGLRYEVTSTRGPYSRELYTMDDVDGRSRVSYAVTNRKGTTASFELPVKGYDVSFLFQKLVLDGVWEVHNEPPRGDLSKVFRVTVSQTADTKSGSRTVGFTDPHYWAVSGGREYSIKLSKDKPVDLLQMTSTSTAEPRFEKIVADFVAFAPSGLRSSIAAARAKLARS